MMKSIYKTRKSRVLLIMSAMPFMIWVSLLFTGAEVPVLAYIAFLLVFLTLALSAPINSNKAKLISLICMIIMTIALIIEGMNNDKFHILYPYFITTFWLYYGGINLISKIKFKKK